MAAAQPSNPLHIRIARLQQAQKVRESNDLFKGPVSTAAKISFPTSTAVVLDFEDLNLGTDAEYTTALIMFLSMEGIINPALHVIVPKDWVNIPPGTSDEDALKLRSMTNSKDLAKIQDPYSSYAKGIVNMAQQKKDTIKETFYELSLGSKKSSLSLDNITSWAKSHNYPKYIASWAYKCITDISASDWSSPKIRTAWLEYRLTEQSTSSLCKTAVAILGDKSRIIFGSDELSLIELSSGFEAESEIPMDIIGKCHTILSFNRVDFGSWYQGNQAANIMGMDSKQALKAALRTAVDVSSESKMLKIAQTSEEALATVGTTKVASDLRDDMTTRMTNAKVATAAQQAAAAGGKSVIAIPEGVTVSDISDIITTNVNIANEVKNLP